MRCHCQESAKRTYKNEKYLAIISEKVLISKLYKYLMQN